MKGILCLEIGVNHNFAYFEFLNSDAKLQWEKEVVCIFLDKVAFKYQIPDIKYHRMAEELGVLACRGTFRSRKRSQRKN